MTKEEKEEQRDLIERACRETGLTIGELAAQIDQKTLPRYVRGEFPLPKDKRNHIQTLVLAARGMGEARFRSTFIAEDSLDSSSRINEEPGEFMPPHVLPRGTTPTRSERNKTPHENFAEAVDILRHLLSYHPAALESLMLSLRGVYQTHKEKE